jgi:hypothetical protein
MLSALILSATGFNMAAAQEPEVSISPEKRAQIEKLILQFKELEAVKNAKIDQLLQSADNAEKKQLQAEIQIIDQKLIALDKRIMGSVPITFRGESSPIKDEASVAALGTPFTLRTTDTGCDGSVKTLDSSGNFPPTPTSSVTYNWSWPASVSKGTWPNCIPKSWEQTKATVNNIFKFWSCTTSFPTISGSSPYSLCGKVIAHNDWIRIDSQGKYGGQFVPSSPFSTYVTAN